MGRTIHYRTREKISKEKFCRLQELVKEINEGKPIQPEKLKIWKGGNHVEGAQVWGFTKVENQEGAELVIESLKEVSSQSPEITWIILDEGRTKPVRTHVKNGIFSTPD